MEKLYEALVAITDKMHTLDTEVGVAFGSEELGPDLHEFLASFIKVVAVHVERDFGEVTVSSYWSDYCHDDDELRDAFWRLARHDEMGYVHRNYNVDFYQEDGVDVGERHQEDLEEQAVWEVLDNQDCTDGIDPFDFLVEFLSCYAKNDHDQSSLFDRLYDAYCDARQLYSDCCDPYFVSSDFDYLGAAVPDDAGDRISAELFKSGEDDYDDDSDEGDDWGDDDDDDACDWGLASDGGYIYSGDPDDDGIFDGIL